MVHSLCDSLLVILNKNREFARKESKEEAERRKGLWIEGCKRLGVVKVIEYDAHWATPETTYKFFEEIENILSSEKRQYFRKGISKFKHRQKELREKSIEYALECITKCRNTDLSEEIKEKPNETSEQYTNRIKERLTVMCEKELSEFMNKAMSLYALAGESPTTGINDLGDFNPDIAKIGRYAFAASMASVMAVIFGLAGMFVGLIMTSVTVATGASVASAVGGGLGAIIGFSGASDEQDKLRAVQSGYVAIMCLNVLWLLSCYGWGQGTEVPKSLLNALEERTKQVIPGIDPINWYKASSDDMKKWIIRFLDRVAE